MSHTCPQRFPLESQEGGHDGSIQTRTAATAADVTTAAIHTPREKGTGQACTNSTQHHSWPKWPHDQNCLMAERPQAAQEPASHALTQLKSRHRLRKRTILHPSKCVGPTPPQQCILQLEPAPSCNAPSCNSSVHPRERR